MVARLPTPVRQALRQAVAQRPPPGLVAGRLDAEGIALAVLEYPVSPARDRFGALTAAERDVVDLVLEGLSNRAIAARRGRSERTVANQLAAIYLKLGVGSRGELAAWAARPGE